MSADKPDNLDKDSKPKDVFDPGKLYLPGDNPPHKPKKRHINRKRLLTLAGVIIFVAIASYGASRLMQKKDNPNPSQPTSTSAEVAPTTDSVSPQELTETFKSSTLRAELKYPNDWKVSEKERGIRIDSPNFTYKSLEGEEVEGHFRLYIRKGARASDGVYIGRGYAINPSEAIRYDDPTSDQRPSTFLTPFGLDKPDNFAYFLVQGNHDLKKGDTLGPKFAREVDSYLIAGGYSSEKNTDDLKTNIVPSDTYMQSIQYLTAIAIVKSLKLV